MNQVDSMLDTEPLSNRFDRFQMDIIIKLGHETKKRLNILAG